MQVERGISRVSVVTFPGRGGAAPPGTRVRVLPRSRRRSSSEAVQAVLSAFRGRTPLGVRGRGESPSESLTRPLEGMRGRIPGTEVHEDCTRGARGAGRRRGPGSPRGPRGGRVDRAQRSGASLDTATRGKPLRLEPRTCEDAWAIGAPAPQRPSRGHRRGEGSPAPATGGARPAFGLGFNDRPPKRSAAERGGRSEPATGAETDSALGVTWLIYTHIFHYPHNTSAPRVSSPLTPSGGGDTGARVCVGARGRA